MKNAVLGILAALLLLLVLGGLAGGCALYSTYNQAVVQENGLEAQLQSDKNTYDNYFATVKEMAQVGEMYSDDLKKVYDGAIKGRYGDRGSQAVFQFIKEHNPNFDATLYNRLQKTVKSGRLDFKTAQDTRIDRARSYKNFLDVGVTGFMASNVLGFPKKFSREDLDKKYGSPVVSEEAQKAFDTGRTQPIKIR